MTTHWLAERQHQGAGRILSLIGMLHLLTGVFIKVAATTVSGTGRADKWRRKFKGERIGDLTR